MNGMRRPLLHPQTIPSPEEWPLPSRKDQAMDPNIVPIWWYCCLCWRFGFWIFKHGGSFETLSQYYVSQILPPYQVVVVSHTGEVIQ